MASEQERLFRWFYRQAWHGQEVRFEEILFEACRKVLLKTPYQADQYVFANQKRLWNALKKRVDLDSRLGRSRLFRVVDNHGMRVQWSGSSVVERVGVARARSEVRFRARSFLLRQIDLLSDRQYEALACLVSELTGADKVHLTPAGNEGGIDALCKISIPSRNHIFGGSSTPVRLVVQCKKYASKVTLDKLRDFSNTLDSVRHEARHLQDVVPAWFYSTNGPVVGWIVAHSGFQSGAVSMGNNQGIVLSDSVDLAEVVAMSRKYYEALGPEDRAKRLKDVASTYIE